MKSLFQILHRKQNVLKNDHLVSFRNLKHLFFNFIQIAKGNGIKSEAASCRSLLKPEGLVLIKLGKNL